MQTDLENTLSPSDLQYIRGLLAEGIARMLVEKVARKTVPDVDGSKPQQDDPSIKKEAL